MRRAKPSPAVSVGASAEERKRVEASVESDQVLETEITANATREQRVKAVAAIVKCDQGTEVKLWALLHLVSKHEEQQAKNVWCVTRVYIRQLPMGFLFKPASIVCDLTVSCLFVPRIRQTWENVKAIMKLIEEVRKVFEPVSNSVGHDDQMPTTLQDLQAKITHLKGKIAAQSNGTESACYAYFQGLEQIIMNPTIEGRYQLVVLQALNKRHIREGQDANQGKGHISRFLQLPTRPFTLVAKYTDGAGKGTVLRELACRGHETKEGSEEEKKDCGALSHTR